MRVTNNMLISNLLYNVNSNLVKMSEYQDELATGKKIQSPSDDPIGISKVLKYKTDLSKLEQYTTNTQDALSWLETTEIALIDMNDALQRVRELTVQAANGTNTPGDLDKIKSEIEQLKNHIVSAANTTYAGRYIFSSYHTDEKLMNDDGTFNLDITNYEMYNQPITQYEIGIGDVMDISTNGLELFGVVETDNIMNTALPDNTVKQLVGEVQLDAAYETVTSAVHQGIYDLTADYSGENLDISLAIDGEFLNFNVDSANLDGSSTTLTEDEVIAVFSNAETGSGEKLSNYAEIKFDTGILSITSFEQGEDVILSGGSAIFGHQFLQASINPSQDYTEGYSFDITMTRGGVDTTYYVDETKFDGTLSTEDVMKLFMNAYDGTGSFLSSVADVYYNSEGRLVIAPLTEQADQAISANNVKIFGDPVNLGSGDGRSSWNIRIGNQVFDVDEGALDGSTIPLTQEEFIEIVGQTPAYSPYSVTLKDVANVFFNAAGDLVVEPLATDADLEINGPENYFTVKETTVDTNYYTVGATKAQMTGYFETDQDYSVKKAKMTSEFDMKGDYTAETLDIMMNISGTVYRFNVDESTLNGSSTELTENQVLEAFKNADDGLGNLLSDFAEVEFDDEGNLTIEARQHGEEVIMGSAEVLFSQKSLVSPFDPLADYTASDFNITITRDGESYEYEVDESLLDGTLTNDEIVEVFKNAEGPTGGTLQTAADVYFDSDGNLVITATSSNQEVYISSADPGMFGTEVVSGAEVLFGQKASLVSSFDPQEDYTASGFNITIIRDGQSYEYEVNETLLDGTLTNDEIVEVFKNAEEPTGGTLQTAADIYFDSDGNLVITATSSNEDVYILSEDPEVFGEEVMSGAGVVFGQKSLVSTFDPLADYTASDFNITITRDGKSYEYEVDETLLDGTLTNDEIVDVFKNANVPTGGSLQTAADIYFDTAGNLVITATSSNQDVYISSADPAVFGTAVNVGKGLESNNLDITIGGITYDVDESLLDGTNTELTNGEIAEIFQTAKAYQPDEGTLMDVADIYFDRLGNLVIQAKEFGDAVNVNGAETVFNTSALKGTINLLGDYTAEILDITINGNVFNVDESLFDGSVTALSEEAVIEALEKATNGSDTLSDVADVYFNSAGELIVQVKDPDPDSDISFDASNTIFAGTQPTNIGRETQEIETRAGGYINDEMVADATDDQSFVMTLDGVTQTVTLDMSAYDTVEEYATGLGIAIDDAFPPQANIEIEIIGEEGQEALVFKTVDSPDDGTIRELDVRAVRSDKSTMMQDFDDLIEALDADTIAEYEAAKEMLAVSKAAFEAAEIEAESGTPESLAALETAKVNYESAQETFSELEAGKREVGAFIDIFQTHLDNLNRVRSDIGGKTNRMELVLNRIGDDTINYTQLLSDAEDADMSEIIMKLKNAENVYQASLSTGARVIQPSLIDFIS